MQKILDAINLIDIVLSYYTDWGSDEAVKLLQARNLLQEYMERY